MLRGQSPRRLSEHYQLECDYGTSVLAIYNEGDPVFLCDGHVSAITPRGSCIAGVRPVEPTACAGADLGRADLNGRDAEPETSVLTLETPVAPVERGTAAQEAAVMRSEPRTTTDASETAPAEQALQVAPPVSAKPTISAKNISASRGRIAANFGRDAATQISPAPVRDLAYGNAAKALVDETIWNMAAGDLDVYRSALEHGKTRIEAAEAAGGQIEIIHRKIGDYVAKIEVLLGNSSAAISVTGAIDHPLEQAILEIIGNSAMTDERKDAAVEHLGALQQDVKRGLACEISPLQAHRLAREIGDRANWGGRSSLPEEVKPAYRAVYASLRDAIRAAAPEARELEERLANLYAAKSDLESAPALKALHSAAV